MGANTIGIDASQENIAIASLHATSDPAFSFHGPSKLGLSQSSYQPRKGAAGSLTYQHTSVEQLLAQHGPGTFDVVCSMEVLEHVDNPRNFLNDCAQLVKVGLFHWIDVTMSNSFDSFNISLVVIYSFPRSPAHLFPTSLQSSLLKTFFASFPKEPTHIPNSSTLTN